MPLVSVVLPFYRPGAAGLIRAAASILEQSCDDLELILINDGADVESAEAGRSLAAADLRVRLIEQENRGVCAAHATGVAASRGEFVARMDADDEALPQRLSRQLALLRDDPSLHFCGSLVRFGGDPESARGFAEYIRWSNSLITSDDIAQHRFVEAPLVNPTLMWRRSALAAFGSYRNGDFPEDYELWLRALDGGAQIAKVPEELLIWNDPPGRLTRCDQRYSSQAFYAVKAEWLARELLRRGQNEVLIWGGGVQTRRRARLLQKHGIHIRAWFDINPRTIGRSYDGAPVLPREEVEAFRGRYPVLGYVGNRGAREDSVDYLTARGFRAWLDFILCA
jgi:glycosyltransferase involved in cell wall biosynthesis